MPIKSGRKSARRGAGSIILAISRLQYMPRRIKIDIINNSSTPCPLARKTAEFLNGSLHWCGKLTYCTKYLGGV